MAYFTHGLETWPDYFQAVIDGNKTFEIRKNDDKTFCVGDRLFLNEWDPKIKEYTGRRASVRVTYITDFAQVDNYIVMGIKLESGNPKLCDCPYTSWCHEVRQWLRKEYRREGSEKTVEDCDFYKMIKEKEMEKCQNTKFS